MGIKTRGSSRPKKMTLYKSRIMSRVEEHNSIWNNERNLVSNSAGGLVSSLSRTNGIHSGSCPGRWKYLSRSWHSLGRTYVGLCTSAPENTNQGDRIRTYGPLYPKQMRWPDCATPRLPPKTPPEHMDPPDRETCPLSFGHRDARTTAFWKSASKPLSFTCLPSSGSLSASVLWAKSPLRSGFEPLTQGFSVLCSNLLSYLNHFPKVSFLHCWAPYLQWRSLLKNREPARPVPGRPSFGQMFFAIDATKNKKEALRS